jgi:RNA polymerase sigma factor (TIGR02999 family)
MNDQAVGVITLLLAQVHSGDTDALSHLAVLAFPELRRLASGCLRSRQPGHTWMPTDLVNELWVRLLQRERLDFQNRAHFLGASAHLMRVIAIDHARARCAAKRMPADGHVPNLDWLPPNLPISESEAVKLLALETALGRLGELSERQARIVEMRYFVGFTVEETAEAMEISPKTVKREWAAARAWLHAELRATEP